MKLYRCSSSDYKDYMGFVKDIYKVYTNFKDSASPVLKQFLYKQGVFCKGLEIIPVMVKKDGSIVAVCMYIASKSYADTLQLAFFEALEGFQEAVDIIVEEAKQLCRERSLRKIVVGLNGHVNYGIGFLCDCFDSDISFGSSYTPPYYAEYFARRATKHFKMVSYSGEIAAMSFEKHKRILGRVDKKFNYRHMSFRNFKADMKVYTDINNICFKEHPFYFERSYEEDLELFKELRYFIGEESIIFVQHGDKPIGYMLWYPDFNELLSYGETIGIGAFIKNKLFPNWIKKLKLVEIAILPEYQNTGAILGLFNECYKENAAKYVAYETSWIFEDNFKSKNFGVKLLENEYKHYVAYEISLQESL